MKIFYFLLENMDKGDVYILGIVWVGVLGFLVILSLIVFKGFKFYSVDYMDSIWLVVVVIFLFLGYWVFCFVLDFVNMMIVWYVSWIILKWIYIDMWIKVVLVFSLGLVFFFICYSYCMSYFFVDVIVKEMGGEIVCIDLVEFDNVY